MPLDLDACRRAIEATVPAVGGRVLRIIGPTVEAVLIGARTGAIFRIAGHQQASVLAEVIGFRDRDAILAPFGDVRGLSVGDPVLPVALSDEQQVGDAYIGRVVDALGHPLDDKPAPKGDAVAPLYRPPPNPLTKKPIDAPLWTDISIIDTMTTVGWGQRLGIFAGPGVGKSTLLGMLARFCNADVNVVALIGERGREVPEFIRNELQAEGLERSVVVVATGDQAPILRIRAAITATTLAEYFRSQGRRVVLFMDSLTRLAHALRETGLASGEPPTKMGYPPSVFSMLPKILERAGNDDGKGLMTAFYTVLVDGEDLTEPVSDAARGMLDGHLILSRSMAQAGRFPAIDISRSLSRSAHEIADEPHQQLAKEVRQVYSKYETNIDLIQVGMHADSKDQALHNAIKLHPMLSDVFEQDRTRRCSLDHTIGALKTVLGH